jgi:hypothetical protein
MASIKKRKRSPYWWLQFRDLDTGIFRAENTKLRCDSPEDTRKAQKLATLKKAEEQRFKTTVGGDFFAWVPAYLEGQYKNERTLKRSKIRWGHLSTWLHEQKLRHPRQIKYRHSGHFMEWRLEQGKSGKKKVGHNTARGDAKFFSSLMTEARRMELVDSNPLLLARIPKAPPEEKREITTAEIVKIQKALESKPAWMSVVFEIQINIGCRFSETRIPKSRVKLAAKQPTVWVEDSKRKPADPRKLYEVPIQKEFATYLKSIKWVDGYTVPDITYSNQAFNELLTKVCGVTSHCCRVTFITRCHRAGMPEAVAMRLVNHSQSLVHSVYRKLNVDDAASYLKKLVPPPSPLKIR